MGYLDQPSIFRTTDQSFQQLIVLVYKVKPLFINAYVHRYILQTTLNLLLALLDQKNSCSRNFYLPQVLSKYLYLILPWGKILNTLHQYTSERQCIGLLRYLQIVMTLIFHAIQLYLDR